MKNRLIILILVSSLQGCSVYYKQAVSIQEAANAKSGVKIVDEQGSVKNYKYLKFHDGSYFGYKPSNSANKIDEKQIPEPYDKYKIYRKNEVKSNRLTFLTFYLGTGLVLFPIILSYYHVD